jgi:hypothetical protein
VPGAPNGTLRRAKPTAHAQETAACFADKQRTMESALAPLVETKSYGDFPNKGAVALVGHLDTVFPPGTFEGYPHERDSKTPTTYVRSVAKPHCSRSSPKARPVDAT